LITQKLEVNYFKIVWS